MNQKNYAVPILLKIFFLILTVFSVSTVNAIEYDYIVVGAGNGGGPLASNLAERGFEVLLLEAGDLKEEDKVYVNTPVLHPYASLLSSSLLLFLSATLGVSSSPPC